MVKVLIIVPYKELEDFFKEELSSINIQDVQFSLAFMHGSDTQAIARVKNYDIVAARGMTCFAISRKFPDITTVLISMTASDVLEGLSQIKASYGMVKTAVLLPDASIISPELLKALTGFDTVVRELSDESSLPLIVEEMGLQGCSVFLGGLTMNLYCQKKGIPSVGIKTGLGTIRQTIQEVENAARILLKERERTSMLRALLDNSPFIVVAVDGDGCIQAVNQEAEAFFSSEALVGQKASDYLPSECLASPEVEVKTESVQNVRSHMALVTRIPLRVSGGSGCIISMQLVKDIYATEKKVKGGLSSKGLTARYHFSDIVVTDLAMKQIMAKAVRYAQSEGNVLLTGETGTGKELFVQSMHNASPRASGPFVAINCATLSEQLLESELFGYAEGAFTGAAKGGKAGLFELAHGGTIFLDEIGEMPISLQARLLRVLQEGEIRRVGGGEFIPVDVRVMSATNQHIPTLIEKGLFRLDLYHRINLLSLHIPPLRERGNDIDLLFQHFINYYADKMDIAHPIIDKSASIALHEYSWPGNIREMRNTAQRIIILNGHGKVSRETLVAAELPQEPQKAPSLRKGNVNGRAVRRMPSEQLYEDYIASGLSLADFALNAGVSRTTLWRRFKEIEK